MRFSCQIFTTRFAPCNDNLDRVTRLGATNPRVRLKLLEVLQLSRSPAWLFHPHIAARAALAR